MKLRRLVVGLALAGAACSAAPTAPLPEAAPDAWLQEAGDETTAVVPDPTTPPLSAGTETPTPVASTTVEATGAAPEPLGTPLGKAAGVPERSAHPAPVGLRMPSIGLDTTTVVSVGVEDDGEFEVPPADQVGWYRHGPAPGQQGSAVLAAHIAAEGVDGAFRDLDQLDAGDRFEVLDEAGGSQQYEVVGLGEFEKTRLPFEELFAKDGPPRLVLITCGGDFNPSLRSYESNVVAFALPV